MDWLQNLSWKTHSALTGRRVSWCAWAWENRHRRFWSGWCRFWDWVLGPGHCSESSDWWRENAKIELIVCRDETQAKELRRALRDKPNVRVISPMITQIAESVAPFKIAVCEGVDLNQDIAGEGKLGALLRQRQAVWGKDAVFIECFDPTPALNLNKMKT